MEDTEATTRERKAGKDGRPETYSRTLMSNKPLHRFLQNEPRSFGIVLLIFACAELLMGFQLAYVKFISSYDIYTPLWEGALIAICGSLSIYTDRYPSKKMVTVSLAMYVVSILGFFISSGYRIYIFCVSGMLWYRARGRPWGYNKVAQILSIEAVLLICSACVFVLLIFLSSVARFALKSTHTEVAIQCVTYPPRATTAD